MLSIAETIGGKVTLHNIHNLTLNGRLAHTLDGAELYRELKDIGVPGIEPQTGHQALLLEYSRFLLRKKEIAA